MKTLSILFLWLASCILSLGAGAINGVTYSAWNGVEISSWNGSGVSAAGGGGGGGGTRWVTDATPLNGTSNSYAGYVGHRFTVGASPITVTTLSRWVAAGSSQTHALKIFTDGGTVVATASLNAALFSNAWGDVTITPVVLSASTVYRIGSEEFSGGDTWHEGSGTPYTVTAVATGNSYCYGPTYPDTDSGTGPFIYGPVSFSYSSP